MIFLDFSKFGSGLSSFRCIGILEDNLSVLRPFFAGLLLVVSLQGTARSEPEGLDIALLESVPNLALLLKENNVKSIGVLPFRLRRGANQESSDGALIQSNFAARLERSLVLIRSDEMPFEVAFDILGQMKQSQLEIDYRTSEGRMMLMQQTYDLPVLGQKTTLDCLISGVIEVSEDWKDSQISLEYCLASKPSKVIQSEPHKIRTDLNMLVGMGRGFGLPNKMNRTVSGASDIEGLEKNGFRLSNDATAEKIRKSESNATNDPLTDNVAGAVVVSDPFANSPVALKVLYDGKPQAFFQDSIRSSYNFSIRDPKEKQRVTFRLENRSNERVGVILSVNGRSLLYGQDSFRNERLPKFVLEPGKAYSVEGLYLPPDGQEFQPLISQSDEDSKKLVAGMPPKAAGLIHMHVYEPVKDSAEIQLGNSSLASTNNPNELNEAEQTGQPTDQNNKVRPSQQGGTKIEQNDIEGWKDSFDFGLARSISIGKDGTFSPEERTIRTRNWRELQKEVEAQLRGSVRAPSRGIVIGQGPSRKQSVENLTLDSVQLSMVYVIRYFSVATP
jgi:hypothetical protein